MKKLVKVVSAVAVMALSVVLLTGCKVNSTSYNENSTTQNGITRTERTETTNGNTTTKVTYKDANGNELTAEAGEAAFNGTAATTTTTESTGTATENDKDSDSNQVVATLTFRNVSGRPLKGLYIMDNGVDVSDANNWGDNLLPNTMENNTENTWSKMTYEKGYTRQIMVIFADGDGKDFTVFMDKEFSNASDPTNVTLVLAPEESGDGCSLNIQ